MFLVGAAKLLGIDCLGSGCLFAYCNQTSVDQHEIGIL